MKRLIPTLAFMLAGAFMLPGAPLLAIGSAHAAGPNGDCTCRYEGGDIAEGQTACLRTAKGPTMARCERFLNNTSWKFLDQPCPQAGLSLSTTVLR